MNDIIHNLGNAQKLPLKLDAWKLLANDKAELVILKLNTQEVLESHVNELDVVFYVLQGKGELEVEGKYFNLEKDDSIYVQMGLNRGWKNTGSIPLKLLVIKLM